MREITIMLAAIVLLPVFASGAANEEMKAAVLSGKVKTAKASWWGFDSEDSTDALQAAINSGARKLIVDNVGKPWIVRPMKLASDQEVVFERGVEVLAKKDEFRGGGDCLFHSDNGKNIILRGYGATLRMRRDDYAKPPYSKAEWRMVLSLCSCSNVKVLGLTLSESGGDGIYLGTATKGVPNRDIVIKDVICDKNYRQGISVISAENLLIENTVLRNTGGTAPQSGIDFEPNDPTERLTNIVMRKCRTENNRGDGYQFYLGLMNGSSTPVSVRIENCVSVGEHGHSTWICSSNGRGRGVYGRIEFVGCSFKDAKTAGASIVDVPAYTLKTRFDNCSFFPAKSAEAPAVIRSSSGAKQPVGGVEFADCRVPDRSGAPLVRYTRYGKAPIEAVSGTLLLDRNGDTSRVELTPQMLDAWTWSPESKGK